MKIPLQAKSVKLADCDFDTDFTVRIIQKLDWKAFWEAAESVSLFYFILVENFGLSIITGLLSITKGTFMNISDWTCWRFATRIVRSRGI
jgi:hypothetical protein